MAFASLLRNVSHIMIYIYPLVCVFVMSRARLFILTLVCSFVHPFSRSLPCLLTIESFRSDHEYDYDYVFWPARALARSCARLLVYLWTVPWLARTIVRSFAPSLVISLLVRRTERVRTSGCWLFALFFRTLYCESMNVFTFMFTAFR